jgi:hypothetical protein
MAESLRGSETGRSSRVNILCIVGAISLIFGLFSSALGADFRSAGHSRWGTTRENGVWWLVTPNGEKFFSIGVNSVIEGPDTRDYKGRTWYSWKVFYPDLSLWAMATRVRLRDWGFNTLGGWSVHPTVIAMPCTPDLELGRLSRFHWFDPFDPKTLERAKSLAKELVAPYKGNPYRIGYFSDNEVGWWDGPLFSYYIQKPSSNHTKLKLVELLEEHYGGDWRRFLQDFQVSDGIESFSQLKATGGAEVLLRPGGQGMRVVKRWTNTIAALYYRTMWEALKEADPEALVLGDRLPIYYDPEALKAMIPYVDVISTNYNVDSPDGWLARYFFQGLRELGRERPVLVTEWFFAAQENRSGNRNLGHLMTVSTQRERAIGAASAAKRFAMEPQVVGIHWFQYWDHPKGGRLDGEDYNFGLVDIDDRPYEELVEALSQANKILEKLHGKSSNPTARGKLPERITLPKADIDPMDRSLSDWPKERALISGLIPSQGHIPFCDIYMAWDERALHLALIAMEYQYSPLVAHEGDFPMSEAFKVVLGVDAGRGARTFTLYVVPPSVEEDARGDTYRMTLRVCHGDRAPNCDEVEGVRAKYFGSDQPRITLELSLPWRAMGVDGPPADGKVKLALGVFGFLNHRWMTLGGVPPERITGDMASWKEAVLEK